MPGVMKQMQGVNQDNALMDTSGSITALGSWVSALSTMQVLSLSFAWTELTCST